MVDYPITQNVGLGADGKFTGGNPSTGESASRLSAAWMNAVTDELLHVLRAAGLNPDEMDSAQLLAAIRKLVWSPDQIPGLDAEKIVSGSLELARLPELPASKINSGVLDKTRVPTMSWDHYPVGAWLYWPDDTPPSEDWTIADGRAIPRSIFPHFVAFAEGEGTPMAYLKKLRALQGNEAENYIYVPKLTDFIRGVTEDVGRYQDDALQDHRHTFYSPGALAHQSGSATPCWYTATTRTTSYVKEARTCEETRPKNWGMLPVIKIRDTALKRNFFGSPIKLVSSNTFF